jgi:NitT/TauT family transport system permease protein
MSVGSHSTERGGGPAGPAGTADIPAGPLRTKKQATWYRFSTSSVTLTIVSFILLLVLWQLAIGIFAIPSYILPRLGEIWGALTDQWPALWRGTLATLRETVIGFAIAVAVGLPLGIAIAFSNIARKMLYPMVLGANAIPKIALAPVFLIWFGFGELPKDMIAALIAFFPIVISTTQGMREIDPDMLHVARVSRASALRIFWKIRLPLSVPSLFSGFKVGITLALTGAVVGEFVAGDKGLGYITYNAESLQQTALAFAAIFLLIILSLVLFYAVEVVELVVRRNR